jgi:hypothetical protein
MKDKIIKCERCDQDFAWTVGEQKFFQEKGLSTPKYCRICRAINKKAAKDDFRGKVKP